MKKKLFFYDEVGCRAVGKFKMWRTEIPVTAAVDGSFAIVAKPKRTTSAKEEEKVSAGVGKIFLGETRCDSLSLTRGKIYLVTLKKEITFSLKP